MTKKTKAKWISILVVLGLMTCGVLWALGNKSKGYQIGTLVRCGEDGNVPGCSTHECEMLVGGGTGAASTPGASNVLAFTVTDNDWDSGVGATIGAASGVLVKAYYEQPRFTNPCRTKSKFYVDKVEVLGLKPSQLLAPPAIHESGM